MTFDKDRLLDLIDKTQLESADGHGPQGWIYFIVCTDTGRCKIGFTKGDVHKRIKGLQTGCPGELALIVKHPGTPDTERRLHERFGGSRIRGEWFDVTDEIRAYMVCVLWAMSEIYIRKGAKLEPWMSIGLERSLERLHTMPESLCEALGVPE